MRKLERKNAKYIKKVMKNMLNGPYESLHLKHLNLDCIICFDKIQKNDHVHLLNEWAHLFHSNCLTKWYTMITKTRNLACPDWDTKNTETSTKPFGNSTEVKTDNELAITERDPHLTSKISLARETAW